LIKATVNMEGLRPEEWLRRVEAGLRKGCEESLQQLADKVTRDSLVTIQSKAARAADRSLEETDYLSDKAWREAIFDYVRGILPDVHRGKEITTVTIATEDRMSALGWSLPYVSKLLEYGGAAVIGGQSVRLPPHPHWRVAATLIARRARQYEKYATEIVNKHVTAALRQ